MNRFLQTRGPVTRVIIQVVLATPAQGKYDCRDSGVQRASQNNPDTPGTHTYARQLAWSDPCAAAAAQQLIPKLILKKGLNSGSIEPRRPEVRSPHNPTLMLSTPLLANPCEKACASSKPSCGGLKTKSKADWKGNTESSIYPVSGWNSEA